jgi:hypothetical protein
MQEAMTSRFNPISRFTDTLQKIWTRFCLCLLADEDLQRGLGDSLDYEAAVEAAERGKASVLDLRYLTAEIFQEAKR